MNIVINWGAHVANAPAQFQTVVNNVVTYLEGIFTDAITVNIGADWGYVDGSAVSSLGQSNSFYHTYTYGEVHAAMLADATSPSDTQAYSSLPGSLGAIDIYDANARALGLMAASSPGTIDGYVGFNSTDPFDFDNSNGVSAGSYDFYGVVLHEITEVLGRVSFIGGPNIGLLDMFRFAAPGVHEYGTGATAYFSIDNGTTNLGAWSTDGNSDWGDWAGSVGADAALAYSTAGQINPFTSRDILNLDVLGYNHAASALPSPDLTAAIVSLSDTTPDPGQTVTVSYTINNAGNAGSGASTASIYWSADATIDATDTLLGTQAIAAIIAGGSQSLSFDVTAPANAAPGQIYYFGVIADAGAAVSESNEGNNTSAPVSVTVTGSLATADDFLGSSATAGQLSTGLTINGTLETAGDHDWFKVQLVAGSTYTFDMTGGTLADSFLSLRDASGVEITNNDDVVQGNLNSQIVFQANMSGTYFLDASGFGTEVGTYTVSETQAQAMAPPPPGPDADQNIYGSNGGDTLTGGTGNDTLYGLGGNDVLNGRAGADDIIGGYGRDVMTGGAGSDYFFFASRLETTRGANHDVITDFTHGTDVIDLFDIDARTGAGNQAFRFIGGQKFHHRAGELHVVGSGANTMVEGDVNGDGRADFQIELSGHLSLNRFDFVL